MRTFTADEMSRKIDPQNHDHVNEWLRRGDGIAVYENNDLGSPQLGHARFASFGSDAAQFPGAPPELLPDFPGEINWRYTLEGVYRGTKLLTKPDERSLLSPTDALLRIIGPVGGGFRPKPDMRTDAYILLVKNPDLHDRRSVVITLDVTTHDGRKAAIHFSTYFAEDTGAEVMVDALGVWDWIAYYKDERPEENRSGTDPNLGGAMVGAYNSLRREDS